MQTQFSDHTKQADYGEKAGEIIRSCVHCGFCNATCPTYQLLGDELDGPRGRIYLIKQMLEGQSVTAETQKHLDRCLTCRACETTCPSGVKYGELLDIGRHLVEKNIARSPSERIKRTLITALLPYPKKYRWIFRIASLLRPILPVPLKKQIPVKITSPAKKSQSHSRKVLLLQGCAQSVLGTEINQATVQVLNRLGIEALTGHEENCCGAVHHHLGKDGNDFIRRNIDAWWPLINSANSQQGIEAIISTASGCGVHLKDYGSLLPAGDPYTEKAEIIGQQVQDIGEFLFNEDLTSIKIPAANKRKIAFHSPCTLQHGQKLPGKIESLLSQCGYELTHVPDAHLCCGSAGTYSLLQPKLSRQLRDNKINALHSGQPDIIATANIGCLLHLRQKSNPPIRHWIELIAAELD